MDIFGIGGMELLVLLLMGGVILGPRRVTELARELGKLVRQIQNLTRNLTRELNREIDLIKYIEEQESQQETHSQNVESSAVQEEARKVVLPEAYQRFREDFPDEGKLDANASREASRGIFVPSENRTNGEGT